MTTGSLPMQQAVETSYEQAGRQASAETDARRWVTLLAAYREPAFGRSLVELTITVAPFLALWGAMLFSLRYSYWLCLLLAVPAAGFLVRLFMIQHDCGHGAFPPVGGSPMTGSAGCWGC
jgi:omega-6 fatty acid desaturase (delta-12 desaturase)